MVYSSLNLAQKALTFLPPHSPGFQQINPLQNFGSSGSGGDRKRRHGVPLHQKTLARNCPDRLRKSSQISSNLFHNLSRLLLRGRWSSQVCAQSFSNSFEGVQGVVRKSGRGPLFSCFIPFLCYNFLKSFEGVHEVPPFSPLSLPPVCIYVFDQIAKIGVARGWGQSHILFC